MCVVGPMAGLSRGCTSYLARGTVTVEPFGGDVRKRGARFVGVDVAEGVGAGGDEVTAVRGHGPPVVDGDVGVFGQPCAGGGGRDVTGGTQPAEACAAVS
jgi:hypothetical protein